MSSRKNKYPWRKTKSKWTDTLFEKSLLVNPSLMTNSELAKALEEFQTWRTGTGKYLWDPDSVKEGAETECPFSAHVLTHILWETISRLQISGNLAMGRYKDHV